MSKQWERRRRTDKKRESWDATFRPSSYEGDLYRAAVNFALVVLVVGILVSGGWWAWSTWYAPASEQLRRETWEQSQSRAEGVKQNLGRLKLEYVSATTDAHRSAIRTMALREVASFDRQELPADLREWVNSLEKDGK